MLAHFRKTYSKFKNTLCDGTITLQKGKSSFLKLTKQAYGSVLYDQEHVNATVQPHYKNKSIFLRWTKQTHGGVLSCAMFQPVLLESD